MAHTHTHTRLRVEETSLRKWESPAAPITVNITTYNNVVPRFTPLWDHESRALSFFRQNNFCTNLILFEGKFWEFGFQRSLHFSFATSKFIIFFSQMCELFINHLCLSYYTNEVVLNACGTSVFFFLGDKFLGHFFWPKIWQNFGNFGLDSSVKKFICADFLEKQKFTNFLISQNWKNKKEDHGPNIC